MRPAFPQRCADTNSRATNLGLCDTPLRLDSLGRDVGEGCSHSCLSLLSLGDGRQARREAKAWWE